MLGEKILFFFSLLGVFNTLLLAIYFFYKSGNEKLRYLVIGLFFLMVAIRVGVSCVYFFDKSMHPTFIQLGLTSNTIASSLLYFLITIKLQYQKKYLVQLVFLCIMLSVFGLLFPFVKHFYVWDNYIRFVLHFITLIYLIATSFKIFKLIKNDKLKTTSLLEQNIFMFYFFTCLVFAISLFTNYILGPIFFSLIFYSCIGYYFKMNKSKKKKYQHKKIEENTATTLIADLNKSIVDGKLFKKTNLKVNDVATVLGISNHQLSQLLNDNLGLSFAKYINNFRVEEAKKLLLSNKNFTIEGIGKEAGFNSKASFFTNFKQATNLTPKSYKELKRSSKLEN